MQDCVWKSLKLTKNSVIYSLGFVGVFFFYGATARGGPWPPFQSACKPLDPLLYFSIRLFPSFSGPQTRHPAISFLVFLCVVGVLQMFYHNYVVEKSSDGGLFNEKLGTFTHGMRQPIMAARKLNVVNNSDIVNSLRMLEF
jgi:hypothetical protein